MLCALAGCAAFVAAPAARASSSPLPVGLNVSANSEGNINRVTASVSSAPGALCQLRVTIGGSVKGFSGRRVGPSGHLGWRWNPPAPAAGTQSPWRFYARCTLGQVYAWRTENIEMGFPSRTGALDASSQGGTSCDTQGVCFSDDRFPIGQCTWYAQGRRPDLLGVVHGNAGTWLEAAKGRVPEGTTPLVGALAVWLARSARGVGAEGHVAYVAAVSGRRILVEDSNWSATPTSNGLEVHEHWVAADSPSGYIYGGPAGSGVG
jgi:surface antigen